MFRTKDNSKTIDERSNFDNKNSIINQQIVEFVQKLNEYQFKWTNLFSLIFCAPFAKCRKSQSSHAARQRRLFEAGKAKATHELDINFLVSSVRKANLLTSVLLDRRQQILCKYQNANVIGSGGGRLVEVKGADKARRNSLEEDICELRKGEQTDGHDEINMRLIREVLGKDLDYGSYSPAT